MKINKFQIVNGILLVNKPKGLTSNAVLQRVKRLFNAKKAGHTGSLDPLATGMLPICFGEATKFSQYLLDADKCYQATGHLGVKTDTSDATGTPIAVVKDFKIQPQQLDAALNQFQGAIQQIPSMYSALKHQGQPLYQYARKGQTIDRPARAVMIHELALEAFDGITFDIKVRCSKGTYIRNLVEDIGEKLSVGAHVTKLHRLYTAGFNDEIMYSLETLENLSPDERAQLLLPIDRAVNFLPALCLSPDQVTALQHGKSVFVFSDTYLGQMRLYDNNQSFIGIGVLSDAGELKSKRLLGLSIN